MTNNQSLNLNNITQRLSAAMQLRSSVFPVIEMNGAQQSLTANVNTLIEWSEVFRCTVDPYQNFAWPMPGVGPMAPPVFNQIQVKVSGYYQIFLSTVIATANAATLRIQIVSTDGSTVTQSTVQTFTSQIQQVMSVTAYIEAGQRVQALILSTVANTLLSTTMPAGGGPSPRLTIAQIAQFNDSSVGKLTRLQSTLTQASVTSTPIAVTLNLQPQAIQGFSPSSLGTFSYFGGGNQLGAFQSSLNTRIYLKETSVYLISAQIGMAATGFGTGTRLLMINLSGTVVMASQSQTGNYNSSRLLQASVMRYIAAGEYVEAVVIQNAGVNVNVLPTNGVNNELSVINLGTEAWTVPS